MFCSLRCESKPSEEGEKLSSCLQENIVLCGIECNGVTMDKELSDDDVIHEQLIWCLAKMFHFMYTRLSNGVSQSKGFKCTGGYMADEAVSLLRSFYEQGNPNAPKPHRPVRVLEAPKK